jgi:hypothetical protein
MAVNNGVLFKITSADSLLVLPAFFALSISSAACESPRFLVSFAPAPIATPATAASTAATAMPTGLPNAMPTPSSAVRTAGKASRRYEAASATMEQLQAFWKSLQPGDRKLLEREKNRRKGEIEAEQAEAA